MNNDEKNTKEQDSENDDVVLGSKFYKEYCLKKEQILQYKWIESEKAGKDIGLDKAWLQWESRYYNMWKDYLKKSQDKKQG
ncbi:MAG: hypothetical protein ACD_79C00761G0003 [uncultured bacterium]|nr:MAG: hypothetical protein ACD_79C00761G0003 [uncultured bacterium]